MVGGSGGRPAALRGMDRLEEFHPYLRDHVAVAAGRDAAFHIVEQALGEREQAAAGLERTLSAFSQFLYSASNLSGVGSAGDLVAGFRSRYRPPTGNRIPSRDREGANSTVFAKMP